MAYGIVYELVCVKTGLRYIGQTTTTLDKRWSGHCYGALRKNIDWVLCRAIREHGPESFQKRILCECESKDELNVSERAHIASLGTVWPGGYNMTNGGEGPCELTRQKISRTLRGRPLSTEHRAAIGAAHTGQKRSDEMRQHMSEAQQARGARGEIKVSQTYWDAARRANTGRKHTDESRQKMRENRQPHVFTDAERRHLSEVASRMLVGRPVSAETRAKSRASNLHVSEEQRAEIKVALAAGATLKSQAKKYGIGVTTVCRIRDEVPR